ncbi:hypothetical protein MMC14_010310 [Varicellaria rhodocarpa]|nr:hypothetical protein [Varicellaria rhodocarpa]
MEGQQGFKGANSPNITVKTAVFEELKNLLSPQPNIDPAFHQTSFQQTGFQPQQEGKGEYQQTGFQPQQDKGTFQQTGFQPEQDKGTGQGGFQPVKEHGFNQTGFQQQ